MTGGTEPAAYQQGERTNHSDNACHAQIIVKLNSCCWKQAPQTVMLKLYALVADEGVGKKEEVLWEGEVLWALWGLESSRGCRNSLMTSSLVSLRKEGA